MYDKNQINNIFNLALYKILYSVLWEKNIKAKCSSLNLLDFIYIRSF